MQKYLLKTTAKPASKESPRFLDYCGRSGHVTHWTQDREKARRFTATQRNNFRREHPHVVGRWVKA